MLHRLSGPLTAKQEKDLVRVKVNAIVSSDDRESSDQPYEFGKIDLSIEAIELHECVADLPSNQDRLVMIKTRSGAALSRPESGGVGGWGQTDPDSH
jgi:hypothetical protein